MHFVGRTVPRVSSSIDVSGGASPGLPRSMDDDRQVSSSSARLYGHGSQWAGCVVTSIRDGMNY